MLRGMGEICGKSLVACQNPAMTRTPTAAASASLSLRAFLAFLAFLSFLSFLPFLVFLTACSRQPAPPRAWLGAVTSIATPAAHGARFPNLASASDGQTVVMSWLEPGADGDFRLRYAEWQRRQSWGAPIEVASGKDWFINWADFPSVVPANGGPWAAHWLQQKPGSVYAYDVMTRLSADGGRTWSEPHSPHDDGTATEHGFVSIANSGGRPYGVWLDGRKTLGEGHDHAAGNHAAAAGAMTLRGAVLTPEGAIDGSEIDTRVCDCCQTDLAVSGDALLVVYRNRSEDETRDIQAARLVDGVWTPPVTVHADGWRIDACPVNGPAVAAHGSEVAVAWFTAPDQPRVRLAFSADGGRSFGPPLEVANGKVVGRVDVVLLQDGRAVVSWLAETAHGAVIRAQPYDHAGATDAARDIATSNVARSSGFPQMVKVPGGLLFAWTESGPTPAVRTAFAPIE